jgi:hypothetical protein
MSSGWVGVEEWCSRLVPTKIQSRPQIRMMEMSLVAIPQAKTTRRKTRTRKMWISQPGISRRESGGPPLAVRSQPCQCGDATRHPHQWRWSLPSDRRWPWCHLIVVRARPHRRQRKRLLLQRAMSALRRGWRRGWGGRADPAREHGLTQLGLLKREGMVVAVVAGGEGRSVRAAASLARGMWPRRSQ